MAGSSGIAPQPAHDWVQFLAAVTFDDTPEVFSDALINFPGSGLVAADNKNFTKSGPGSFATEIRATITGVGAADTTIRVVSCPDGDPTLQSGDTATFRGGTTAIAWTLVAAATQYFNKILHWEDVGSGFRLGFVSSTTEVKTVNAWYRGIRVGNPAVR
jgi:hypothetical protein